MDETHSDQDHLSAGIRARFDCCEVRNAAGILVSTATAEWQDNVEVLESFALVPADILGEGGNKSDLAACLDESFRERGWREGRVDTLIELAVRRSPYRKVGEKEVTVWRSVVENKGYKVDNLKGRVALDVEWNAKDGNLDRDLAAYRALYDAALIDAAVLITRTQDDLRAMALHLSPESTKFATTTTTNLTKLRSRLTRGDAGGCPVLALAITARCLSGTYGDGRS